MVKFNRQHGKYGKGEVAKFSADHEAWLVKKGVASVHKASKEEPVAKSAGDEKTDKTTPPAGQQPPPQGPQTRQTTVGPQSRR